MRCPCAQWSEEHCSYVTYQAAVVIYRCGNKHTWSVQIYHNCTFAPLWETSAVIKDNSSTDQSVSINPIPTAYKACPVVWKKCHMTLKLCVTETS